MSTVKEESLSKQVYKAYLKALIETQNRKKIEQFWISGYSSVDLFPPKKEKLERELKWIQQTEEDIVHIHLRKLISSTPNDFELGRLIREMYGR